MKVVIVGAGEVGFHVAGRFAREKKDVVVIDTDPAAVRRVLDSLDVQAIQGSGSSPRVLAEAGVRQAEIMLAVTDSDEVNLVACLASNMISPTTTGFVTADYEMWPVMAQMIVLFTMFIGGSAGSIGGGMKCLRIMLGFKFSYREHFNLIHPHAVSRIRINQKVVSDQIMNSVLGFLALYLGLFALGALLLAAIGVDLITSLTAVISAIGNIGPAFGTLGPAENYAHLPMAAKWVLIWCMLLGRLEIYTLIVLLVPEFWRK